MEIIKADYLSTCFGVENALSIAYRSLEYVDNLYCYGELIHNNDVMDELKSKGLKVIENIEDINDGHLIIRSHGVAKSIYDYCQNQGITIIDATCPKVKYIHKIVEKYCNDDYNIIVFGNPSHPEVQGIVGWCHQPVAVFKNLQAYLSSEFRHMKKQAIVFQTTYNTNDYKVIKEYFKNHSNDDIILNSTICHATELRQDAVQRLARECDSILIIGGKQSSNTKKLYEISKEICEQTFWIENSKDIPYNLIKNSKKLGITAGASTPSQIVEEVIFNVRKESNA